MMASKFLSRLSHALQKNRADPRSTKPGSPLGVGALVNARYRLEAEIGRGGMGIVYRAYDIAEDRDVAIKVINLENTNALTYQQFLQEAEISVRFHHPHIVKVYETGAVETATGMLSPFIVMEWVQGRSLADIHQLTYATLLDIAKQICDALEYAHNLGFVYRDLKPGNVLLEKRGFRYFVKLSDFGLARPRGMAYLGNESSLAGSVFYLAPELIAGEPADIPSDLYALGATLYEMITGRVPFSDFDEGTILSQHVEAPVAPPSQSRVGVPPALETIILRLLAKHPGDRFASAAQVWAALERVTLERMSGTGLGNLPRLSSEVSGHKRELAEVRALLEANKSVTILGDEEALALEAGANLADQFADGAWWVDVESVGDASLVLETVASMFGVHQDPQRSLTVALVEHLQERELLLVLTGCHRFLGACARLAETILKTCPDVHILATGIQPLAIAGEKIYRGEGRLGARLIS